MTDLQKLLDAQSELQRKMPSAHPSDLFAAYDPNTLTDEPAMVTDDDRMPAIDFMHWNVTATVDELHELLSEIGWKPWAKSRHINLEAARGEWIDALHFMMNLALVLGLNAEEIEKRYFAKHEKNAKRQEEGYDGVSTKCPGCKRALDDDAVECKPGTPIKNGEPIPGNWVLCQKQNAWYNITDGEARRLKPGVASS